MPCQKPNGLPADGSVLPSLGFSFGTSLSRNRQDLTWFRETEKFFRVGYCRLGYHLGIDSSQTSDGVDDERDVFRLVGASSVGDRRKVGAVGLHQQSIERDPGGHLGHISRLLESHDSGDAYVAPQIEKALRPLPGAGEAMHHHGRAEFGLDQLLMKKSFAGAAVENAGHPMGFGHHQMAAEKV